MTDPFVASNDDLDEFRLTKAKTATSLSSMLSDFDESKTHAEETLAAIDSNEIADSVAKAIDHVDVPVEESFQQFSSETSQVNKEVIVPESVEAPVVTKSEKPIPEADLTPEQKRIRELEHQLAIVSAKKLEESEPDLPIPSGNPPAAGTVQLHFVADGFTAFGKVWLTNERLEIPIPGKYYTDTLDRNGVSWLDDLMDENGKISEQRQFDKWGTVYFREGPVPTRRVGQSAGRVMAVPGS